MEVRALGKDDLPALLGLYAQLHPSDEPLPEEGRVLAAWDETLGNRAVTCFGGFVGENLVSTCMLVCVPNLTRGCRPFGLIENVVTHNDFRRRGYGRALLTHAMAHAWSNGCYKVMLLTSRLDAATFEFYESVGFSRHDKQSFVAKPDVNNTAGLNK